MHAIDIGIGGDHDLVVPQVVHILLDVERRLQQVELLVLIYDLLREAEAVERLAPQRKNRLRTHVAALGDRTGCRITLRDEDHRLLGQLVLVRQMYLAVAQLLVVERHLLGRFAGFLLNTGDRLALLLVLDDLLLQNLGRLGVLVQVVVQVLGQKIDDEVAQRNPRFDLLRAQFDLGLRLEHRIGHTDRNGGDDRRADVRRIVILVIKLLDGLGDRFTESRLMRTALRGVLSIDERIVTLAVTRTVCDGHFDILARKVDRRIERLFGHVLAQEVQQAVLRNIALAVETEGQPQIEVSIVANHLLDILQIVGIVTEHLPVHTETDKRTVFLLHAALPAVALFEPLRESHRAGLAVAHRTGGKFARKHIDGLDADSVQSDGLLEGRTAVLAAGIHLADGRSEGLERNAAPVVADSHDVVLDRHVDLLAGAHDELIDRVVHHLLDQDVNAVVGLRAVAQLADIHTRPQPDMLPRREGHNGIVAIAVAGVIYLFIEHNRLFLFPDFGEPYAHRSPHLLHQLLRIGSGDPFGAHRRQNTYRQFIAPVEHPVAADHRGRTVEHHRQNFDARFARQRESPRLETIDFAVVRTRALRKDRHRSPARKPQLSVADHLLHRGRSMSPVDADIPVQQKELAEKRHLENFPLGNPPEVERYEIEGRNIQAGLVIDHDNVRFATVDILPAGNPELPQRRNCIENTDQYPGQFVHDPPGFVERPRQKQRHGGQYQKKSADNEQEKVE